MYVFLFQVAGVGNGEHVTKLNIQGIPFAVTLSDSFLALSPAEQGAAVDRIVARATMAVVCTILGLAAFLVGRAFRYVLAGSVR